MVSGPDSWQCDVSCRTEKRDARREAKALTAAKLETSIKQELLSRLKQGTYGDIYNFDQKVYERVLEAAEVKLPSPLGSTCSDVQTSIQHREL